MSTLAACGAAAVILLGAMVQRVTGMGLALVAAPFIVLVLGPNLGVQTLQVVGITVCTINAWSLRGNVDWRRAAVLIACAALGIIPGTWVARVLPTAWLSVVIGVLVAAALLLSRLVRRNPVFEDPHGRVVAGMVSGFMNVTAGVGGPPMVIYASTNRWAYAGYLATIQVYFLGISTLSLLGRGLPVLPWPVWALLAVSVIVGLSLGRLIASRIDERTADRAIFAVALVGAVSTAVQGVLAL
ncbi:hypothetical protein SAMN05216355_10191 [Actinomyces ruminicola]|uniref:Probable membrane transporter protein n=1 Tax=Actinomyces ruminicola TaxID=332524 RepID=A0A1G9ZBH6_9ACTO|nr:sulfite exporter TauE/SafE family protein [Actinomyces ruminicola]SDN18241.1 hypothetical protein SAMN05216355_10191 [Actinomyces ruminicola]